MSRSSFRDHIRSALADAELQAALDGNAERRRRSRASAVAGVPDWLERRRKAHAVRARVVAHLEEHLEEFIMHARANGIGVHRARDGAEAVRLVLEIASGRVGRPLLFAKAKSMVSEEIELNHALEAAGHLVVETDLGEFIVQLRGERPSHIITPAVHLRRQQVGRLFSEKLGIPYTEDIPTLTNTARRHLRAVFLNADVGISGVNFGVAATGGLCLVTNEGNGRMVTTLPRLHIALMGMERLVPTLDDLALMLSLLARSSSGQKMSVYTQVIHRPLDGQERHLVILDNGRKRLSASPLSEILYCIRCGACLNACPVFRELGGHSYVAQDGRPTPYPGPLGSVLSAGLFGRDFAHLAQASSLCGACREVCPIDIDLPKLLLRVRAGQLAAASDGQPGGDRSGQGLPGGLRWALTGFSVLAAGRPVLFSLAQRAAGLAGALAARQGWFRLPAWTGWGLGRDLPCPDPVPFRARWRKAGTSFLSPDGSSTARPAERGVNNLTAGEADQAQVFQAEVRAAGGEVHLTTSAHLAVRLAEALMQRGIDQVLMADAVPGLTQADLAAHGIHVPDPMGEGTRAGITGALAGVVQTGSLLIAWEPGQPLTTSLLPEIHICVLKGSQLIPSLEDALRLEQVKRAPVVVFITGPSRTADIEMALTIGAHGPRELLVFLVDDCVGE